jgi:hypothetical protein
MPVELQKCDTYSWHLPLFSQLLIRALDSRFRNGQPYHYRLTHSRIRAPPAERYFLKIRATNKINMANVNARTGHVHDASRHLQENCNKRTQLNTYIYEYFFHHRMFDCAQAILKADSNVKVQRHGPRSPRDDKHCRLKNALYNESISIGLGFKRPEQLPVPNVPNVPNVSPESCFLYEWFCLFWAIFNAQKNVYGRSEANQHVSHMQVSP